MRAIWRVFGAWVLVLLCGCATTLRTASIATDRPFEEYRELYGVYPGAAGSGISRHLVRSHTTALAVRPVSSLYEQGRIHHHGAFAELEDQYCTWVPDEEDSPDRLDAAVWGFTELMLGKDSAGIRTARARR